MKGEREQSTQCTLMESTRLYMSITEVGRGETYPQSGLGLYTHDGEHNLVQDGVTHVLAGLRVGSHLMDKPENNQPHVSSPLQYTVNTSKHNESSDMIVSIAIDSTNTIPNGS